MDEVRREVQQCLWPSIKQGGSFHGLGLQCLIASGFIFEHNNAIKNAWIVITPWKTISHGLVYPEFKKQKSKAIWVHLDNEQSKSKPPDLFLKTS